MTSPRSPAPMPGPVRPSKHSRAFAEKYNLPSADPKDFDEAQLGLFEQYKKEQDQERQRRHYEKRVANGTAPRRKLTSDLTEEELERRRDITSTNVAKNYARKQALRNLALDRGLPVPSRLNDVTVTQLREILRSKLTQDQIDQVEKQAVAKLAQCPPKRKAPDETGARKPGPPKIARVQEEDAAKEASRSAENLRLFFDANPDIPRVNKVADLQGEYYQRYRSFKRQLNIESYRERERAYDAAHRKERSEASRQYRLENPEVVRAIERKYKQSEIGRIAQFLMDARRWAAKKEIPFELKREDLLVMLKKLCFYCGDPSECVDAVDMHKGFVDGNMKPCCRLCNQFKKDHHYKDFVRIMGNIGFRHAPPDLKAKQEWTYDYDFVNPAKDTKCARFGHYIAYAQTHNREFQMTEEIFEALAIQPCHYCGIQRHHKRNGVDRVDSSKGYVRENIVSACGPCNLMKRDFDKAMFLDKAVKILQKWSPRVKRFAGFFDVSREN